MDIDLLVSAPTYKRPGELVEFLDAVSVQLKTAGARLLVVDNDPDGSARETVEMYRDYGVSYVVESSPGIAAARNRALTEWSRSSCSALVFVDDDEVPDAQWLATLKGYARESDAGIVTGPVVSILPDGAPRWIVEGGFHQRTIRASGSSSWTAASNNTLLKRDDWQSSGSPTFDPAFSKTGGSDTDFFSRLVDAGVSVDYCAEAIVFEKVPEVRLSRAWLSRRAYRMGVVNGIVLRRQHSRAYLVLLGVATAALGLASSGLDALRGQYPRARNWNRTRYGFGMVATQFGWRTHEYSRG